MTDVQMTDGRSIRGIRTRSAIVAACQEKMRDGIFRPSAKSVAAHADCSVRSVFQHFSTIEALHIAAIDDAATRDSLVSNIEASLSSLPVDVRAKIAIAVILGWPAGLRPRV